MNNSSQRDALISVLPLLLNYGPKTGEFVWQPRSRSFFKSDRDCAAWNTRFSGKAAGRNSSGYIIIRVLGHDILAHRIAWAIHFGVWPEHCIDHIDGNRANNAIVNLRDVPMSVNNQNITRKRVCKTNLPIGVFIDNRSKINPYISSIKVNNKTLHLGYFRTAELAHEAYVNAKRKLHEGCTL